MPTITQKLGFEASGAIATLNKLAAATNNANTAMQGFNNTAKQNTNAFSKQMANAKKNADGLGSSLKLIGSFVAGQLLVRSFMAVTSAIKQATKESIEFRLSIAEIQTIGGDLHMTNDEISASVLRLSDALGKSAQDVAEGLYQVLSNQVVDAADAISFLETAEKLAIVTHSATSDAVDALSSVMNSYGLAASEADRVSASLFKTVELGRLRMADIANILGRVTPLTAEMGVKWEEAAAAIATMTRQGVRADTAVTQLRAIMQKIIKPTDDMTALFRKWGVADGPAAIKAFGGLHGLLQKMSKETGGNSTEMAKYFRRVRAIVGVMGTMTNEGKDLISTLEEITEETDAMTKAWEAFVKTDAQQLTIKFTEIWNALLRIGEVIQPVLLDGATAFEHWIGVISDGAREIRDSWNEGSAVIASNAEKQEEAYKKIAEAQDKVLTKDKEGNAERETEVRSFLAGIQQKLNKYDDLAQIETDAVGAVFESFTGGVLSSFDDANKGLEKFVKGSQGLAGRASKELASLEENASAKRYKRDIENARGANQIKQVMNARATKIHAKLTQLLQKGIRTDEDKAQAMRLADQEETLRNDQLSFAKKQGHYQDELSALGKLRSIENIRVQAVKQQVGFSKQNVEKATELNAKLDARKARLKTNLEYLDDIAERFAATDDAEIKTGLLEEIEKVEANIQGMKFTDMEKSIAEGIVKGSSEGMDAFNKLISEDLKPKIADVIIDHTAIQQELLRDTYDIRVNVLGTPQFEELGADFGATKQPGESSVEFLQRALELAQQVEKTQTDTATKVNKGLKQAGVQNELAANGLRTYLGLRLQAADVSEKEVGIIKSLGTALGAAINKASDPASQVVTLRQIGKQLAEEEFANIRKTAPEYYKIADTLVEMNARRKANLEITKAERDEAAKTLSDALKSGAISQAEFNAGGEALRRLFIGQEKTNEAKKEAEGLDSKARKASIEFQQRFLGNQDQINSKTGETATKVETVKEKTGEVAAAGGAANTQLGSLGSTAAAQVGGVITLTNAVAKLADEAERAAVARAAAGSGDTAQVFTGAPMRYFKDGGPARGQDTIPTMLSKKETVINARNSSRFFSELNAMNQGSKPVYREQGGPVTNVGDVNVSVNGGDSSQQTVREIGNALRREIKRGTLKLS